MRKIIVVEYNPKWAEQFEELRNVLFSSLKKVIIEIEHVGSTSIIGLKAKPIIDIDIIIKDDNKKKIQVISKLEELGYIHLGNLGITGREAFNRKSERTPTTRSNRVWFEHHLYLCKVGNIALENHIKFRNYLRSNREDVIKYSELKEQLAYKYPNDIDSYIAGKTDFIVTILTNLGFSVEVTKQIEKENEQK